MLSKEEIENMKLDILNLHHMLGKKPSISKNAIKNALKYIDQLELDKQKLIEKLEEDNNIDTERVRHYEKAYRNAKKCGDTFYMKSHKRKIDTANARREVRKSILEILKKE